jgi:hypothetical protein
LEGGQSGYIRVTTTMSGRKTDMSERVSALFPTRDDAERAAAALMDHGVSREEISLLARGPIRGDVPEPADPGTLTYTSDADVKGGAAAGAGVGGLLGLLATAAALTVPGFGPVLAAGTFAAALATGTAMGGVAGAIAGGVYGALRDLGMGESDAQRFERGVQAGATLVSVHTPTMTTAEIQAVFAKYNASDVVVGVLPDPDPRRTSIVDEDDIVVAAERGTNISDTPGPI